jgi:hypothetical protein
MTAGYRGTLRSVITAGGKLTPPCPCGVEANARMVHVNALALWQRLAMHQGSYRLDTEEGSRLHAARPGWQAQMGEDSDHHRGIFAGGDDPQ